jgi:DNA-binding NarL/FixJ family response regulator
MTENAGLVPFRQAAWDERIKVLIVDDHDLLRAGLRGILTAAGIDVVGEAADGAQAVAAATQLGPDVVLMDIEMPGIDGLSATSAVLAASPATRVLVLTMFDLDEYVFQALRAGASGFLLKTTPPAKLVEAIRGCAAGETPLAPSVVRRLVESYVQRPPTPVGGEVPAVLRELTPKELDVLRRLGRGRSNVEIGAELFMAEPTVKAHVTRILAKLGLRDRVQAAVLAHECGFIQAEER